MVELHFRPCLLLPVLAAVSFVILCGIVDDCSDGSVMIVACSSVTDFCSSHKDVKLAFVENVLGRFIL